MDTTLFRPQAIISKQNSGLGPVSIASPPSHKVWIACAIVAAAMILLCLAFGQYTRRERVPGSLVPAAGLVRLTARESGTVAEVLVAEGDVVVAGQALLRISGEKSSESLGNIGSAVTASLALQEAAVQSEVRGTDRLTAYQQEGLRRSEVFLKRELGQFARQLDLTRQQSAGYVASLERIRPLVKKGYVSQLQMQQQEAQALESRAQTEALMRQKVDMERQLSDIRSELAQLPASSDNKQSELQRQHAQIRQTMLENEVGRLRTVVATSPGTVSSLLTVAGQSVSPGEALLAMVPTASPLEAHLLVPSSAIGFVRVGTPVRLRYVAFPYQKFGIQGGHVTQVSKSALTTSEVVALGGEPAESRQSRYRIRVALDQQTILAYGKAENLLPGMTVEADLLLDRRTLFEWLLEPMFGARQRMKETGA
jgi:membrane fusion protein